MPHSGLPQTRRPPWINTTSLKVREHTNNPLLTVVAAASGTQAHRPVLRQTEFRRTSQTKFRMNTSRSLKAEWRSAWVSFRPSTRKQQHGEVGGGAGKEVAHAFQVLMITAPSTDAIHQNPAHWISWLWSFVVFISPSRQRVSWTRSASFRILSNSSFTFYAFFDAI
jgi:hypothetical protein